MHRRGRWRLSDEELALSILTSCGCVRIVRETELTWTGDMAAEDMAARVAVGHSGRPHLLSTLLRLVRTAKAGGR